MERLINQQQGIEKMNDIQNNVNDIINSVKNNLLKPMTAEIKDCVTSAAGHYCVSKINGKIIIILSLTALNFIMTLGLILFFVFSK